MANMNERKADADCAEDYVDVRAEFQAMPAKDAPGLLGESRDPQQPLFSWLQADKVEASANSKVNAARDLLTKVAYAKGLGHGAAYNDLTNPAHEVSSKTITNPNEDNSFLNEFESVDHTDISNIPPIKVVEEDGVKEYIPVRLKTESSGIIAQALISPTTGEMKVLFRGTSDGATGLADLEKNPGSQSFAKDRDRILSQINGYVSQFGINKRIIVTGHSLGAALAQQCQAALIDARAQNQGFAANKDERIPAECRNNLNAVTDISGYFYNSAGVSYDAQTRCKAALKFLADNSTAVKPKPNISGNYLHVDGDAVQKTGQTNLFADVPPEHAFVSVTKFKSGYKGAGLRMAAAGAVAGATAGLAAGSVFGPMGSAAGFVLGGIGGAIAGAVPAALATHCNGYITEQPTHQNFGTWVGNKLSNLNPFASRPAARGIDTVQYDVFTNETQAGQQNIDRILTNKSYLLNNPVTRVIQSALHSTISTIGGFFSSGSSSSSADPQLTHSQRAYPLASEFDRKDNNDIPARFNASAVELNVSARSAEVAAQSPSPAAKPVTYSADAAASQAAPKATAAASQPAAPAANNSRSWYSRLFS